MKTYISNMDTGIKPLVIDELRQFAMQYSLTKLILFGSRARGSYTRASDIDLAAAGGKIDLFRLAADEETSTLLTYDVVNLDRPVQVELLDSIQKEGLILYEKA